MLVAISPFWLVARVLQSPSFWGGGEIGLPVRVFVERGDPPSFPTSQGLLIAIALVPLLICADTDGIGGLGVDFSVHSDLSAEGGGAGEGDSSITSGSTDPQTDEIVARFIETQRVKAFAAYDMLYDDGLDLDGEPAPELEIFVENYLVETMHRETAAILQEKGYDLPKRPQDVDRPRNERLRDVKKKDSPKTLEGEIDSLVVQKRQKRAIRERVREGKTLETLAPEPTLKKNYSWDIDCWGSEEQSASAICGALLGNQSRVPCWAVGLAAQSRGVWPI